MKAKVLVVDPRGLSDDAVVVALRRHFAVSRVERLEQCPWRSADVALLGPGLSNPAACCQQLRAAGLCEQVVVLGANPSLDDAIEVIRAHASDFVPNGSDATQVIRRVNAQLEAMTLRRRLTGADAQKNEAFSEIIGDSEAIVRLRKLLGKVARADAPVVISGESGTGKDLVARALHAHGPAPCGPFVVVDVAAIPPQLMESELFGHAGGDGGEGHLKRPGLLSRACGGTLVLDDIAAVPLAVQTKLDRVLHRRRFRPLGGHSELPFHGRVISITAHDLEAEVAAGRVRKDLFFRLNVLRLPLTPLRSRGHDIIALARHFIAKSSAPSRPIRGLSPAAAQLLMAHDWPGNVRELEHCITAAVAVARYDSLIVEDFPEHLRKGAAEVQHGDAGRLLSLRELERLHILRALRSVNGNKALAARLLGVDRKTLYRKLEEYASGQRLSSPQSSGASLHAEGSGATQRHRLENPPLD